MAFPDFSEFSFAYAIVRQIEAELGGLMAVPNFPTQNQEVDFGYDVDFLSQRIPLFIQFKRSEVMTRNTCKEFQDNRSNLTFPIYRMHLYRRHSYRQHFLMQDLESAGNTALYCTSSVKNKSDLDQFYANGQIFDASAIFFPSDIGLPSLDDEHHVSFDHTRRRWRVYSDTGDSVERHIANVKAVIDDLRSRPAPSLEAELAKFQTIANDFATMGPEGMAQRQRELAFEASPTEFEDEDTRLEIVGREQRQGRIQDAGSVVLKVALQVYFEVDAFLVSVSREATTE
jgi:hypothetical protein